MTRTVFFTSAGIAACALFASLAGSFSGCGSDAESDAGAGPATCNNDRYSSSCLTAIPNGCFKAEGKCVWKDKTELDWANGAKITNVIAGTEMDSTFWSVGGDKCFTAHVSFASAQSAYDYTLTTNDGKVYAFHTVVENSKAVSTDVTCPDGKKETYSQADFDAVKACYQSGGSTQDASCKCADGTYGCLSTTSTICNLDTDCIGKPEGGFCCDVGGTKICQATACGV